MKNLKLLILLVSLSGILNAQKSLFYIPLLGIDTLTFDTIQLKNYHKLLNHNIYNSINFVKAEPLDSSLVDTLGRFSVSLPFLPCNNMVFQINDAIEIDSDNYTLYGRSSNESDTVCSSGEILLVKKNGVIAGHYQDDDRSYEIYDLKGGGVLAVCHADLSIPTGEADCAVQNSEIEKPEAGSSCDDFVSKIIVFVSPAVMSAEIDVPSKIALAEADINTIWSNSNINNPIKVVATYQYAGFTESSDISDDMDAFLIDPGVQSLRAAHEAEIVVLLTDATYGYRGVTQVPFAYYENAYSMVVSKFATTALHTFAHEVSHNFGACHEDNPTNDNTHAHKFNTGKSLFFKGKERITLMYGALDDGVRIPHVSNPNAYFMNVGTGNAFHNNAEEGIEYYKYRVGSFYADANVPEITINRVGCTKNWDVSTSICGGGSYTYSWYRKNLGSLGGLGTLQGTGSSMTINLPNTMMYVKCVIKNSSNVVVYTLSKLVKGFNCDNNRMSATNVGEIAKKDQENDFSVFPNPSNGSFNIQINSGIKGKSEVFILDILGKEIARISTDSSNESKMIKFEPERKLAPGMYLVKVKSLNKTYTQKIVVE